MPEPEACVRSVLSDERANETSGCQWDNLLVLSLFSAAILVKAGLTKLKGFHVVFTLDLCFSSAALWIYGWTYTSRGLPQ